MDLQINSSLFLLLIVISLPVVNLQEGNAEIAAKMQELALAEGALPRHLHTAMFTQSSDTRMLTNRQLSRHLVSLWVTGAPTAMGLLKRSLVRY